MIIDKKKLDEFEGLEDWETVCRFEGDEMIDEELKIYKQAVMDLIDSVGNGPRSTAPKSSKPAKYVWMVHGNNPCDIRRYAYSHQEAVAMVDHRGGLRGWNLYKLVRVNKRKAAGK